MGDASLKCVISAVLFAFVTSLSIMPVSAQTPLWGHGNDPAFSRSSLIDTYTLKCMGCHEYDTDYELLEVSDTNRAMRPKNAVLSGHPVGARYENVANGRSGRKYRSVDSLDVAIMLPDGMVSCVSCHEDINIESRPEEHGKLVLSNSGSRLCFECHNM
jgi:hypothetical protein